MDVKLSDFIWTTDTALKEDFCEHVIKKFENDDKKEQGVVGTDRRVELSLKDSIDLHISRYKENWDQEDRVFFESIADALQEYWKHIEKLHPKLCPIGPYTKVQDLGYQVKRYEPNGYYHWHHDYTVENTGARALTFIWYLNDGGEEGVTEFIDGTIITPKAGKLLIFPATWCYLHRGLPPKVGRKYIATGWLYTGENFKLDSIPKAPGEWTEL
tara:strand:+ start:390 stop:1031 length:642 start_codon:yes stop_codon:yes gene_type:complete